MAKTILGVIGGSGVYAFPGLRNERWEAVSTPWGAPSDELHFGTLATSRGDVEMVFLPRHGRGHPYSPTSINYRANIDAMKRVGVTDIISVSAVGSLKEEFPPGTFVIVDQFIDRTFSREKSFFGPGCVAHVSMARPVCPRLGDHLEDACRENRIPHARGGTYVVMEGPQFSTLPSRRFTAPGVARLSA
jgi:5'-methylthioadenosine phosphorylase